MKVGEILHGSDPRYGLFQSAPPAFVLLLRGFKHAAVRRGAVGVVHNGANILQQQTGVSSALYLLIVDFLCCAPKVPDKRCGYFTLPESAAQLLILQNRISDRNHT